MGRSTQEDGGPGDALASEGREAAVQEMFAGSGEVRDLARTLDWGATRIGWPNEWSPALRIATRAMLDAPFPICLWSGPSYALVYNDAYRRVLSAKHPAALGQPGALVWAEIWDEVGWQFEQRGPNDPVHVIGRTSIWVALPVGGDLAHQLLAAQRCLFQPARVS